MKPLVVHSSVIKHLLEVDTSSSQAYYTQTEPDGIREPKADNSREQEDQMLPNLGEDLPDPVRGFG